MTSSICPLCGCKGHWIRNGNVIIGKEVRMYTEFICSLDTCRNIFHSGVYGGSLARKEKK